MTSIANALRDARFAAGLQQSDVARALGISPGYLSDMEHGNRPFLDKYLDALPEPMRRPVAKAVIDEARGRLARLEQQFHVE